MGDHKLYQNQTKAAIASLNQFMFPSRRDDNNTTILKPINISHIGFHAKQVGEPVKLGVILPAVGCFCFGILIASIVGFVLYKKQRQWWRKSTNLPRACTDAKLAMFQNDPLGDFFQHKEGTVSQDAQSALNFLATPFTCNTHVNTAREQALFELQNEIDRETKGESCTDGVIFNNTERPVNLKDIKWELPDSDVIVNIPAGAMPRSISAQNSLKVALGANPLNVLQKNDQVQLSPLLILSSPTVLRYNKPIEVRIPHRAHLTPDAVWTVVLKFSGTIKNNINKLEWSDAILNMRETIIDSDVTYRYDTEFVYVKSYIPGLFCAVGTGGRKKKPLKVAALAFAYALPPQTCEPEPGQETGNCGIDIKVFFVDNFREAIQLVQKSEEESGGVCISQPLPLRMVNEKDWQVLLVSASTPQWPYRVPPGQRVKVISTSSLYENFGLGHMVEFQIFSKMPPDGGIDKFQATFSLTQMRRNPSAVVATLLTTETLLLPRSAGSVGSTISKSSDEDPFIQPVIHRDLMLVDPVS